MRTRLQRLFDAVFRNPETGRVVIAQLPNPPLAVFLAATAVRVLFEPEGVVGTVVTMTGRTALLVWAALEILWGESLFRRFLGLAVLLVVAVGLLT
ncbi:MAG TPA: hypothetical protein VM345_08865 [Acidimicrobiales bacterium]|nr:hypothetical protein [Acidimicrobiales bacterium]